MKHIPLAVACGIIIALTLALFLPMAQGVNDVYAGNLVFDTEADYLVFKEEIIRANATWGAVDGKMEMLASTPPIIVEFKVRVSRDYDFPYGKKDGQYKSFIFLVFFLMAVALFASTMIHLEIGVGRKA